MSTFGIVVYWFVFAWLILGAIVTILTVGKPREPITPGVAAAVVVVQSVLAILFLNMIYGFWF